MKQLFKSYWADESGQGLTEYALIIALVSIGLIAILILFTLTAATCEAPMKTILSRKKSGGRNCSGSSAWYRETVWIVRGGP